MPRLNYNAVIFDCDGTLVDSEPITTRVFVEYAGEFGFRMPLETAIELFAGRDMAGIVAYVESEIDKKLPDDFTELFRLRQEQALRDELLEIPGATDLLESMTEPFCVASNAPHRKIKINLEVTGLDRFFHAKNTFSAYDIDVWKPDPALFLHAAEYLDVKPEQCVVVEDSEAGIHAGLAAGMQVVAYDPEGLQNTQGTAAVIKSLAEAHDVF